MATDFAVHNSHWVMLLAAFAIPLASGATLTMVWLEARDKKSG
jgi:hypothetical protein